MIEQLELPLEDPRSNTPLEMVKEYQEVSGQGKDPTKFYTELTLYADLVEEEWSELQEEWNKDWDTGNDEEILKELADLVYVLYGWCSIRGWDLDQALWRVHDNNMGRMYQPDGTIKRREDGKIIKNKDYPKVELGDLV